MKKDFLKFLSIVMAITVILCCVVGCTNKGSVNSSDFSTSIIHNETEYQEGNSNDAGTSSNGQSDTTASSDIKNNNENNKADTSSNKNSVTQTASNKNEQVENNSNNTQSTQNNNQQSTNTNSTSHKTPSTSKKVTLNKQRLYEHMMSVYKLPVLNIENKMSRTEFVKYGGDKMPAKYKDVYNWLIAVVLSNGSESMPAPSLEEVVEIGDTFDKTLKYPVSLGRTRNSDGNWIMYVEKAQLIEAIDNSYNIYSHNIDISNNEKQKRYNNELKAYNEEKAYVAEMCDIIDGIGKRLNLNGKTQTEAVNAIVKYICDNCGYDWSQAGQLSRHTQTIGSCLKTKLTVCAGYSKTFYAICYYAGIDVTYYEGKDDRMGDHAWNSVTIDGKKYYFDVTNQDSVLEIDKNATDYVWCSAIEFSGYTQSTTKIFYW